MIASKAISKDQPPSYALAVTLELSTAISMISHTGFKNMGMYSPQVNIVKRIAFKYSSLSTRKNTNNRNGKDLFVIKDGMNLEA